MPTPAPIFVAGTGRSGTSQLATVIGEHPLIHRIPMETRFLVDPGGVRELADALTSRYDPFVGGDALRRLHDFVMVRLASHRDDRGRTVPEVLGEQRYREVWDDLWPRLVACAFDEPVTATGLFEPRTRRRVLARHFSDRSELITILRHTVGTLFGGAAADAGKPVWCEKTPYNLLYLDFLWELFPEATIVHVKRHPLAVVASHVEQAWAPPTVEGVLAWLQPVYQRWLAWKAATDLAGRRYIEVKAEDLAADWPAQRRDLFHRLGVDDFPTAATFDARRLNNRDPQFGDDTRAALAGVVSAMGYA